MSRYRRILVIHNPVSGYIKLASIPRRIESRLREEGVDFDIRETTRGGDGERWARTAQGEGFDLVIVAGGDGTVREAVDGIVRSGGQVPLAIVPAGTGNIIALSLSIPIDPRRAIDLVFKGESQRFDVGYLPEVDRYFMFVAGAGYDAHLIRDTPRQLKKSLGFFAYVAMGTKHFFRVRPVNVVLELDDDIHIIKAHTVMTINIGGIATLDWAVGPNLDPRDGKLNVMVLSTRSFWGSLFVLFRILTKRYYGYSDLRHYEAKRVRVVANPPLPVEIDGEPLGTTPFRAHVIPNGIPLIVPAAKAADPDEPGEADLRSVAS